MRMRSAVAKVGKTRDTPREILAEGLAPKKPEWRIKDDFAYITLQGKEFRVPLINRGKKGNRNWTRMSPKALLEFARAYCTENEVDTPSKLAHGPKALSRLYSVLKQKEIGCKKLFDLIFPKKEFEEMKLDGKTFRIPLNAQTHRNWAVMNPEALLEFTLAYCKEKGITKRSELEKGSKSLGGLYDSLKQRKLKGIKLIELVFPKKEFEEMVLDGRTFRIPLDNKGDRNWVKMTSKELVEFTKAYCKENKITKRSELAQGSEALHGLHILLNQRELGGIKLIDIVLPKKEFEEMKLGEGIFRIPLNAQTHRNWAVMSSEALIDFTKAYCKENGITKRIELEKGSKSLGGLYDSLKQRKLDGIKLIELVFPRKEFEEMKLGEGIFRIPLNAQTHRNWAVMSQEELLGFAKAYCKEKGITKRSELQKKPKSLGGLCVVLKQRGLLDAVFSDIKQSRDAAVLSDLEDALESFGGSSK